jgi:hypothetical protein
VKNCICFSRGVQMVGAVWWGNDKDRDRSRRPDAEDRGWLHRLDTRWPDNREVG